MAIENSRNVFLEDVQMDIKEMPVENKTNYIKVERIKGLIIEKQIGELIKYIFFHLPLSQLSDIKNRINF